MILVVDAVNKEEFGHVLDDMFRLRARVFGDRLGWQVTVEDGRERDVFDDLNPSYAIGLDDEGNVVSCVRALQTTGPHMLADVFSDILDGEPPLRSATLWESTRFCVDTKRLGRGRDRHSVSYATCELMIASLEAAKRAGISDIVTVIDPVMDRVLKRSGNAPYDYLGKVADMCETPALAALLDCTDERIARIRAFAGIDGDVFISDQDALALPAIAKGAEAAKPTPAPEPALKSGPKSALEEYCDQQIAAASTPEELEAARRLEALLAEKLRKRA